MEILNFGSLTSDLFDPLFTIYTWFIATRDCVCCQIGVTDITFYLSLRELADPSQTEEIYVRTFSFHCSIPLF